MSKAETRALTDSEQEFADAMLRFSQAVDELRQAGAKVKSEGGDTQYAVLTTVEDESEKQMLAAQWPMLQMAFGL